MTGETQHLGRAITWVSSTSSSPLPPRPIFRSHPKNLPPSGPRCSAGVRQQSSPMVQGERKEVLLSLGLRRFHLPPSQQAAPWWQSTRADGAGTVPATPRRPRLPEHLWRSSTWRNLHQRMDSEAPLSYDFQPAPPCHPAAALGSHRLLPMYKVVSPRKNFCFPLISNKSTSSRKSCRLVSRAQTRP